MRLTENRKKRVKRCSSVKGLRRLISVFLLISVSLCGCKSILVSGDLSFTAYDPVEPEENAFKKNAKSLLATVDFAKYSIEGESAYWMPPNHLNPIYINVDLNEPTENVLLADFKAVGYSEEKDRFVYAYLTPLFVTSDYTIDLKTGLSVPQSGDASNIKVPVPGKELSSSAGYVMSLMSYEPATKHYNVFYSTYYSYAYYSENQPSLMAGKVEGHDYYYIYDPRDMKVNIYNIDGVALSERTYMSEINSAVREMLGIPAGWSIWEMWLSQWKFWRYSVLDIQVDDALCVYFNLQVEISSKSFDDSSMKEMLDDESDDYDDSNEDSDEDYDEEGDVVYFNAAVSTYSLPIGGPDATIKFTSSITTEAKEFCQSRTSLDPVYVALSDDLIEKAKDKIKKAEGDNYTITPEKVMQNVSDVEGYESYRNSVMNGYNSNSNTSIRNAYYNRIAYKLNNGYSIFDTTDLQSAGIDIYFALAGVPDLNNMKIMTSDGTHSVRDPRQYDNEMSSVMNETFDNAGNMKKTDLSYANIVVANYLAARSFSPYYYYDMPYWMRYSYSTSMLYQYYSNEVNLLMSHGILAGYFIKDGSDVMYPFLTPGNFGKAANDGNRPNMKWVNYSPYAAEDLYIGSDGFVKYSSGLNQMGLRSRLPIVLVYGGQEYSDGTVTNGYQVVTNDPLANISDGKYTYCLPKMVVDKTMTVTVSQPVYFNYSGRTKYVGTATKDVEIPIKYRMEFPKGSEVSTKGNIWTGEGIKALAGLGCVTYKDKSTTKRANGASGLPYDDLSGKTWSPSTEDKTQYSWIQQMHLGSSGAIFDEGVKGLTRDVGVYTAADGTEELIMITEDSMRFYAKENGRYNAFKEVPMDTIRRVSGYGLTVQDEKDDGKDKSSTDKIAEDAMDDEQQYNLLAENLMPYNRNKLMICHESDGVSLYDTNGETMMKLIGGHYYRIYPMKETGKYVLLGFQTEEYDYSPGDLSMAKYYVIDLGKQINEEGNNNISAYIDELMDMYHSKTHTIRYVKEKDDYEIVAPDPVNDKDYARAVRLLTGSEQDTLDELAAICKDYDVAVTDELKDYALDIATKVRKQRQALNLYYRLIGIQMNGMTIPDNWQYLKNESQVFTASYEGMLEIMLVEMVLSDDYMNMKLTHPVSKDYGSLLGVADPKTGAISDEYAGYREAYRQWQLARTQTEQIVQVDENDSGVNINDMDTDQLKDTIVDLYSQRENEDDAKNITQMEFYQAVLRDIMDMYDEVNDPTGENDIPDFSHYMAELFKDISPDYGQDVFEKMQESGYEQFYAISGLPVATEENKDLLQWDEQELKDELAKCRYEWQVEEVIVKYKLMTAEYLDKPKLQESWDEYTKKDFDGNVEEQQKAFEKGEFHVIIDTLKAESVNLGIGKSWNEIVGDILRKVGNSPIVK